MKAAIYVRQSLDRSGESLAVSRQLDECHELVERHGWEVAEVYSDNDVSASDTRKPRPAWDRMLSDLSSGRHDVLVCWHTDRLYRRLQDLVGLLEIADQRALRIASVRAADLDLSTPAGRMLATMLASAARYEVEQKGARQKAANKARAAHGHMGWTRRPFGYDRDENGSIVVVEREAESLRAAAQGCLAGQSMASLVRDLDAAGSRTSTGGHWSVTSLRRALLNPRAAGIVVYGGQELGPGAWPAILPPETQAELSSVLRDTKRRKQQTTEVKYLLSGLARCGRCDGPMFAQPAQVRRSGGTQRQMLYRCRTPHLHRDLSKVDALIEDTIVARLQRPDAARLLSPEIDLDAVRSRVVVLEGRRDALAGMLADGVLGVDAVSAQAAKLTRDLDDLRGQIAAATSDSPLLDVVGARDVEQAWTELDIRTKRAVIDLLCVVRILPAGKGVRFSADHIEVVWR